MTNDATDSRPLDLSDLREAESLGRAWDAWLRDDIEPVRHQASQTLAMGIAATVEDLYDWDDTPAPAAGFRRSLKRDLLHMHDALRAAPAANPNELWPASSSPEGLAVASDALRPEPTEQPTRPQRWRLVRRWWPALELAAAAIVILALFGITFGNARIAEFFRDNNQGNFASQGDGTENPAPPSAGSEPEAANAEAKPMEAGAAASGEVFTVASDVSVPMSGTLYERWPKPETIVEKTAAIPEQIVAAEGYVAVVGYDDSSLNIVLSLYDAETGNRLWRAGVNDYVTERSVGRDAAPVIADGMVYFVNRAGFLYIFDIARFPDPADPTAYFQAQKLPFDTVAQRILLANGILYVTGGSGSSVPSMTGIGQSLFVTASAADLIVEVDVLTLEYARITPIPMDQEDVNRPSLYKLDLPSGAITNVWVQPVAIPVDVQALDDGSLAVTFGSESETTPGVTLFDPVDMHEFGTFEFESVVLPANVTHDTVIVTAFNEYGEPDLQVVRADGTTARVDLAVTADVVRNGINPIVGGDATIVVSEADAIRLYSPSGELIGETPIGLEHGQITALDTDSGSVYVAFMDGRIVRFDSDTAVDWTVPQPQTLPEN